MAMNYQFSNLASLNSVMTIKQSKKKYNYLRFIFIPIVFIGSYILAYLIDPNRIWSDFFNRNLSAIITEVLAGLVFCLLITEISLGIARYLDKKIKWVDFPFIRVCIQFGMQIFAAIIFFFVFVHVISLLVVGHWSTIPFSEIRQSFVLCIFLSLMISLIYTGNYFLQQWKCAIEHSVSLSLKNAEFKQIALEAELESLKMQMDPHFMFNNFSTLSALISEDQVLAEKFLENLSRVYRYMIVNMQKNLIILEDEIAFAKSYFYLMEIRLGDNVRLNISLSKDALKRGIPPISLQLLIENAIKHNTASRSRPLIIEIHDDEEFNLIVSNTLQKLTYNIPSTNLGLKNIQRRYGLLSEVPPEIRETDEKFMVKLPLIKTINK